MGTLFLPYIFPLAQVHRWIEHVVAPRSSDELQNASPDVCEGFQKRGNVERGTDTVIALTHHCHFYRVPT